MGAEPSAGHGDFGISGAAGAGPIYADDRLSRWAGEIRAEADRHEQQESDTRGKRTLQPIGTRVGDQPDDETIEVSVILKPKARAVVPHAGGAAVSREEFAAKHGADSAAIEKVKQFAKENNLTVGEVSAERRTVKLEGTAANMAQRFRGAARPLPARGTPIPRSHRWHPASSGPGAVGGGGAGAGRQAAGQAALSGARSERYRRQASAAAERFLYAAPGCATLSVSAGRGRNRADRRHSGIGRRI